MSDELQKFMAAIRQTESSGNYGAIGANMGSRYGVAQGAYQIMSGIWPSWAKEFGYDGLSTQDFLSNRNGVQDKIAAAKMMQYYRRYDGDWGLVAAAWFSGIGNADKAHKAGVNVLSGTNDGFIDVPEYVRRVMSNMGSDYSEVNLGQTATQAREGQRPPTGEEDTPPPEPVYSSSRAIAQRVIEQASMLVASNPDDEEVAARAASMLGRLYNYGDVDDPQRPQDAGILTSQAAARMRNTAPVPTETGSQSTSGVR